MPAKPTLSRIRAEVRAAANAKLAEKSAWFFQARPGGYGEGDRFLGIRVPEQRRIARRFRGLSLLDAGRLLESAYHEERLIALLLLVDAYEAAARGDRKAERKAIFRLYLDHKTHINNWDLVDTSAPAIVGAHVFSGLVSESVLLRLLRSRIVWERRIAALATLWFIRERSFDLPLRIAEALVQDEHDLIHKAVGWMLRELGERDRAPLERFLRKHAATMPRTMLRYSIEKFPESLRRSYLQKKP